jgi:hypothetical protein
MPHIGDCLDIPADAPRAPIVGTSQSGDQAAWIGQAGDMDGHMDMTRVNSAVRNPVSLGANARNRAKRGIDPLRARNCEPGAVQIMLEATIASRSAASRATAMRNSSASAEAGDGRLWGFSITYTQELEPLGRKVCFHSRATSSKAPS